MSTLIAIVAGMVFLKESLETYHLIGSIAIAVGVLGNEFEICRKKMKDVFCFSPERLIYIKLLQKKERPIKVFPCCILSQKSLNNRVLSFFLCQSQSLKFDDLFAGDLSDGRFVN